MSDKLLPCPFCGGTKINLVYANYGSTLQSIDVVCQGCFVTLPSCNDEDDAHSEWNTRSVTVGLPEAQKTL